MAPPTKGGVTVRVLDQAALAAVRKVAFQLPLAAARALNTVAQEFQRVQREYQSTKYEERDKKFMRFSIRIDADGFAKPTPGNLNVTVYATSLPFKSMKAAKPEIFRRMQYDRRRVPKRGRSALAIPQKGVKRTATGKIRKSDRPLEIQKRDRDFKITFPSGDEGVFERLGKRQKAYVKGGSKKGQSLQNDPNVVYKYVLRKGPVRLQPNLDFFDNAKIVWEASWATTFERELVRAFKGTRIPSNLGNVADVVI